jgi:diguanylate cyclase (GGDEF)-like protein
MVGRFPIALAVGVVGLAVGVVGLATDVPALGLLAGVLALAAGAIGSRASLGPVSTPPVPPVTVAEPTPVTAPIEHVDEDPARELDRTLVDPETGLYTEEYFRVAVETRVLAARRHLRPVAVVLFDVIDGPDPGGERPADPMPVADAIRETLREADTACRLSDGRYAFVLEDTPEDGAIWTVERLRRTLSSMHGAQTRWAGIACYPAHAFSADEVLDKAEAAFRAAREWTQDRIEVAVSD